MKYDVLHNFISPVTGRVLSDRNYVLYGNAQGIAVPSPILTDIRLDLMNLRKDYEFTSLATFVLNTPNEKIPHAQALSELTGGLPRILKANIGGIIEVAVKNVDYATLARLEELADEAAASEAAAAGSAADALVSAGIATGKALQAVKAANDAEGSATAAAASATSAGKSVIKAGEILIEVIGITAIAAGTLAGAAFILALAEKAAYDAEAAAYKIKQTGIRIITTQNSGIPGAAGAAGVPTLIIDSNIDLNGARIENISASPGGDYDAISAQFAWNFVNDNVEIVWQ
jgi:hypothetical protein